MKKGIALSIALVFAMCLGVFALAGCSSNSTKDFEGVWQVQGTNVTVVYTDKEFKTYTATYEYTVDSGKKTITRKIDGIDSVAEYEFSNDKKTMTLKEDNGDGGTTTTVFEKVSDDTSAEPSAGIEGADAADASSSESSEGSADE